MPSLASHLRYWVLVDIHQVEVDSYLLKQSREMSLTVFHFET